MVDYRKTYRNYQSFSKYLIINYYLLFMIHNIRHISISFSFTISIFAIIYYPRKLKLKYSPIKNAVPSIKIRTPSSNSRQSLDKIKHVFPFIRIIHQIAPRCRRRYRPPCIPHKQNCSSSLSHQWRTSLHLRTSRISRICRQSRQPCRKSRQGLPAFHRRR